MAVTTNVPGPTFGPKGFIAPTEAEILAGAQSDINAAFGGGLNPALETPQGQLASSQAAVIGNVNDTFLKYTQQVDPAYADGRMQDAIARIYFIERYPALPTVVQALCLGAAGVLIPTGSQAASADGNLYTSLADGLIGLDGTVSISFACNLPGPIPCPAGSLDTIYRAINGWDSITNPADGALGRNTETRAEFEDRRRLSVAQNANGSLPAVLGAVLNVDGVLDAFVTENVNNTPLTIKGFTLAANSIYVAAVGGNAADVAKAIWSRKSPGCGYNGNTTVIVLDRNPSYNPPYPAYNVSFEIPESETVTFQVTIANNASVPANAVELIQAAVVAAFAGTDGGPRARIGDTIYASRYYGPIAMLGPWAQIITVKVGCANLASSTFVGSIAGTTLTVSAVTAGIIGVGQSVIGGGVLPGTVIISGSGLVWTVSMTQTVGSATMSGVVASNDDVSMQIDQEPVVSFGDVSVTLL